MMRIFCVLQDDRFYDVKGDGCEDDDGDESDAEDGYLPFGDRRSRFQKAYEVALATDTQGYRVVSKADEKSAKDQRTAQEITAISWAAFCTEILPDAGATYRIQALDSESLFDRLKLASHMLREKKTELRLKMEKSGLTLKREDMDGDTDDADL